MNTDRYKTNPFANRASTERWIKEHIKLIDTKLPVLDTLDKLQEVSIGLAITLQDKQAELQGQYWILANNSHPPIVMVTHWNTALDRRAVLQGMHHLFAPEVLGPMRYSVASEAWAVAFDDKDSDEAKSVRFGSLSKHERRVEILMVFSVEREPRAHRETMYDLVRDPVLGMAAPPIKRIIKPPMAGMAGDLLHVFEGERN